MELALILVFAGLYGASMKMADLLDEHGLQWFKGSAMLFGVLWGLFGSLLVYADATIANVLLADVLGFLVRMRIDYRNHAVATAMIVMAFLQFSTFKPVLFYGFFAGFALLGIVRDILDDYLKRTDKFQKIMESSWYYVVLPLGYSLYTSQWLLFYAFTAYVVFYNVIKYLGEPRKARV